MLDQPCLYLIRHAQSDNNAKPDNERIPDPSITSVGVEQSQRLARSMARMKPTVLYCSPFLRSMQTTEPIARLTGLVPRVRQDIYEQGGCHEGYESIGRTAHPGMSLHELSSRYPQWHIDERIQPGGWFDLDHYESEAESRERAVRVRRWFESAHAQDLHRDRVAMVIHADFKMRLIEAFLEHDDIEHWLGDIMNTSVTRLSRKSGRWRLDWWNDFSHLDGELITC